MDTHIPAVIMHAVAQMYSSLVQEVMGLFVYAEGILTRCCYLYRDTVRL